MFDFYDEIYKEVIDMPICEICGKDVRFVCSEGYCAECHYEINGECCQEFQNLGYPELKGRVYKY